MRSVHALLLLFLVALVPNGSTAGHAQQFHADVPPGPYLSEAEAVLRVSAYLDGDVEGRCYEASLATYTLVGGAAARWTMWHIEGLAMRGRNGAMIPSHWFLRNPQGRIVDLTVAQFDMSPPYERAIQAMPGTFNVFPKRWDNGWITDQDGGRWPTKQDSL
jgi:hypothetical protein